jgi:putative transposase
VLCRKAKKIRKRGDIVEKAYKFRLYPNKEQQILLAKTFGCTRFVYNYYLDKKITAYKTDKTTLSAYDCIKDLTSLKKEYEWLKEPDKCALQNTLKDLDSAYKGFFKSGKGFPKFKSKKTHKYSYRTSYTNNNIQFLGNLIKLPKLGKVKIRDKQIPQGRILNATISQTPSGKYYCSLCCTDVAIEPFEKTGSVVGIDLGIKEFAITSDSEHIENPKYLAKSLKKLARLQRQLSRKTRGSNRWNKARIKVAKCQEHIANQRADFLHKLSTRFIKEYDIISLEDLNVSGILKNHSLARSVSDVSWSQFTTMLQYKANWYGKEIIKIDRFFASSQLCNVCGYKNTETKDLSVRSWVCPVCGTSHDRDVNASINILKEGLKQIV